MRTSPSAHILWPRTPIRDGVPHGAGTNGTSDNRPRRPVSQTPVSKTAAAKTPVSKTPVSSTPEAKIAKQAAAAVSKKPANLNPSRANLRKMLTDAADRHGIPREILMAIAYKESNWTHYGRNGAVLRGRWSPSDQGIMQINENAHPNAFPRAANDIRFNIEYGARYLKYQYDRYKNWDDAIAAYNHGSARRKPKSAKLVNQYYVDKVTVFRKHFETQPDSMPADL